MKTCTKCKLELPLSSFGSARGKPRSRCLSCERTIQRESYAADPEHRRAVHRARAAANSERHAELKRNSATRYRLAHPGAAATATKRWLAKNPGTARVNNALQNFKRRTRSHPHCDAELMQLVVLEAVDLCQLREAATGIKWEIDHPVPLRGKEVSGLHVPNNIAVVPKKYNKRKHCKMATAAPTFITTDWA